MTKKVATDTLRNSTLQRITEFLVNDGDDVRQTKTGTIMFPAVDALGDEVFVTVTIQIPKGARDGEGYDGYAEAQNFVVESQAKQEEKLTKETAKQKKIERDKKAREAKAKAKAEKGSD